jgi:uncharacterized membrane protein YcaP (DUF421 family)
MVLFDGWQGILRTVLAGVSSYLCLVVLLRLSGKRTLSKMNAFDLVVTVALGSTLATILLSKEVALLEGITALALLVLMQFGIAWLAVRSSRISRLVKSEPVLLLYDGQLLTDALRRERVVADEVMAALRSHGSSDIAKIHAVVLETDGSFTVIPGPSPKPAESSLQSVRGIARATEARR